MEKQYITSLRFEVFIFHIVNLNQIAHFSLNRNNSLMDGKF